MRTIPPWYKTKCEIKDHGLQDPYLVSMANEHMKTIPPWCKTKCRIEAFAMEDFRGALNQLIHTIGLDRTRDEIRSVSKQLQPRASASALEHGQGGPESSSSNALDPETLAEARETLYHYSLPLWRRGKRLDQTARS